MNALLGLDLATIVKGLGGAVLAVLVAVIPARLTSRAQLVPERDVEREGAPAWLVNQLQEERDAVYSQMRSQDVRHAQQVLDLEAARVRDRADHVAMMAELRAMLERAERVQRVHLDYIEVLRRHISDGKPSPPPPWPEERAA